MISATHTYTYANILIIDIYRKRKELSAYRPSLHTSGRDIYLRRTIHGSTTHFSSRLTGSVDRQWKDLYHKWTAAGELCFDQHTTHGGVKQGLGTMAHPGRRSKR
jgi:cbb3-type cytochrome oxidase cytochrome c subunit